MQESERDMQSENVEIAGRVRKDAFSNLVWTLALAGLTFWLSTFWPLGAKFLFWIIVVITVMGIVWLVATVLVPTVRLRAHIVQNLDDERPLLWATGLRTVEECVAVLCVVWLWHRVY